MAKRRVRASGSRCVDKNGVSISRSRWLELNNNDAYRVIKEYENEKVLCIVEWYGIVPNRISDPMFMDSWPVFLVKSYNRKKDGTWQSDPVYTSEHHTEQGALQQYKELLVGYTSSDTELVTEHDYDADGNLITVEKEQINEVGNLRSPDVIKQKAFQAQYENDDTVGSW